MVAEELDDDRAVGGLGGRRCSGARDREEQAKGGQGVQALHRPSGRAAGAIPILGGQAAISIARCPGSSVGRRILAMALPAGIRLGPYEILAPLGAGGMGDWE